MHVPEGYTAQKSARSGGHSDVCHALRVSDGASVLLKSYPGDSVGRESHAQREFSTLRSVAGPGIPRALEMVERSGEPPLVVLELVPGGPLRSWIESGRGDTLEILKVAIQLTRALARVHAARIVHRGLSPDNVLVDPISLQTHLVGFGRAFPLGSSGRKVAPAMEGGDAAALHYTSPEQTGRMNRGVDMRSDLYSLGATLYFALTRRPPFDLSDPLALLHAHLARRPQPPTELRPGLPVTLSRLVMKLLEKEPDDRYQGTEALLSDLQICREQMESRGRIDEALSLGSAQAPSRPQFPRRVYGREYEVSQLRAAYQRAVAGSAQVLVLRGEAGSGKSALMDELRPDVAQTGGYLAIGTFSLSQERPYAAWVSALVGYVKQRLMESDERLVRWSAQLRQQLGNIAQVAIDLVPELRFALGEVPPVPTLGAQETQARLALALRRLLHACATRDHPLVLFLDDLQWSDAASRALLEDLLISVSDEALLLVGAFRSHAEVGDRPEIGRYLEHLAVRGIAVPVIAVGALSVEGSRALLADTLGQSGDQVRELAELIERKTGNTPLLVRQFVDHLHSEGLLQYVAGGGWTWDNERVASADVPEGAVALLTTRLGGLDSVTRAVVELASCFGEEFDLELLSELSDVDRGALEQGLYAASDAGLIAPSPNGFRFVHDRVREAARELQSEDVRTRRHHAIARLLLERTPMAERVGRTFEIGDHLRHGIRHVSEDERLPALQLQLAAGKLALASGAAATAEKYLAVARALMRREDWVEHPQLGFELLIESIESAFLRQDFEAALGWADRLEQSALQPLQVARVAAKRLQVYALVRSTEECAHYALEVLARFGLRWPRDPSRARAMLGVRLTRSLLRLLGIERALRPAPVTDPRRLARLIVLGTAGASLVRSNVYLGALVSSWVLASNARHGYVARPSYSLASFGLYVQLVLEDSNAAAYFESTAEKWQEKIPDPVYSPRYRFQAKALTQPWRMSRHVALVGVEEISESMREVGDLEFFYYARFLKLAFLALGGEPVPVAAGRLEQLASEVQRAGHRYPEPASFLRPYRLLQLTHISALSVDEGLAASEAEIEADRGSVAPYVRTAWMMVLSIYGEWTAVLGQSDALGERLFRVVPFVHVADHMLYRGLAAAALSTSLRGSARRAHLRVLRGCLARLSRWARSGPDFVHMAALLRAEQARLRGRLELARELYQEAAQGAHAQRFAHHAALAHERRARMLIEQRRWSDGEHALAEAARLYRAWGARAKAASLEGAGSR